MATSDKLFTGAIPEIYDRLMVPLIFEPYALDLARRVEKLAPHEVLEVAAGTGVVTRALASKLPALTHILAMDLNLPMLDYARARVEQDGRLEWAQADALSLPFDDDRFDVVLCQFGAMFFPDRVQGYWEARRVLKPGGCFLFNVWDTIRENAFADVVTQALATLFPDDPPCFLSRTPHGYCDIAIIRAEVEAAGFEAVSIEAVTAVSKAPSALEPAMAYCQGTPLRNEIEARGAALDDVTKHVAQVLAARFGHGPIEGRIRAFVITAV